MDTSSIDPAGSEVASIEVQDDRVTVRFSRAYIMKTMTGSAERTRWWQAGDLIFGGAEVEGEPPVGPCICAGGDVGENVYTYRDMIPLPLDSQGHSHCRLRFEGTDKTLIVEGDSVRLVMQDRPHYIEHIRVD